MTASNTAIIRRELRDTITFVGIPEADIRKQLHSMGFEYSRRDGYWFRKHVTGSAVDEGQVLASFIE